MSTIIFFEMRNYLEQWQQLKGWNHLGLLQWGTSLDRYLWRSPWMVRKEPSLCSPPMTRKTPEQTAMYYVPHLLYLLFLPSTQIIGTKMLFQLVEVSKCICYLISGICRIYKTDKLQINNYNYLINSNFYVLNCFSMHRHINQTMLTFPFVIQRRPQYVIGPKFAICTITERYEARLQDSGSVLTSNGSSTHNPFMLIQELIPNKMARTSIKTRRLLIRTRISIFLLFDMNNFLYERASWFQEWR